MLLTTIAIVAQATPAHTAPAPRVSASASAAAAPAPDPAVDARAKAWFDATTHGKLVDATQLTAEMANALTPADLQQLAGVGKQLGAMKSFTFVKAVTQKSDSAYVYHAAMENADAEFIFVLDPAGKIDGMWLRPWPKS